MWQRYLHHLQVNPYRTNVATSVIVTGLGDTLAQAAVFTQEKSRTSSFRLDTGRIIRTSCFGAVFPIPAYHWFKWLDATVKFTGSYGTIKTVVTKLAINQSTYAPVFNFFFFGYVTAVDEIQTNGLQASTVDICKKWIAKLENDFIPTTKRAIAYWTVVNAINFSFVPPSLRILIQSVGGVFWTGYLCIVGRNNSHNSPSSVSSSIV